MRDLSIKEKKDSDSHGDRKRDFRTKTLKGAGITVIYQGCNYFIGMAGGVILARLLTPKDFGLVAMALTFSLLFQSIGVNGFSEVVIQSKEINYSQISSLFWINTGLSLALSLLLVSVGPFIAWFYNEPALKKIVLALAISVLMAGFSNQHQGLLIRDMKFSSVPFCEMCATFVSMTIAILLAYLGWGYWALVAKWVINPVAAMGGFWTLCKWRPELPVGDSGVKSMVRYAAHTSGIFLIGFISKNIDKILIGRFLGTGSLGSYDRARQLSMLFSSQIVVPLTGVSLNTFRLLTEDLEKFRQTYLHAISILAFCGMLISAILTLIGGDLIQLLLGPKWDETGKIFPIISVSIGAHILGYTQVWLHLSLGTTGRWFRWNAIGIFMWFCLLVVGLQFGLLAVSIAYSASLYILLIPSLWYAGMPINLRVSSILEAIWKSIVSGVVSLLFCWVLLYSYDSTSNIFNDFNILSRITVSITLCGSIYLLLVVALHQNTRPIREVILILKEMIP